MPILAHGLAKPSGRPMALMTWRAARRARTAGEQQCPQAHNRVAPPGCAGVATHRLYCIQPSESVSRPSRDNLGRHCFSLLR
jgi:hypothetical protein